MSKPQITVSLIREGAKVPKRQTNLSSGFDLYSAEDRTLYIGSSPIPVETGVAAVPPDGYELQIRPRSGLTLHGVHVGFGTIDADYRGEIIVVMWRYGRMDTWKVEPGDRIAQLVCAPVLLPEVVVCDEFNLEKTVRGARGFGSTGR